MIHLNYHIRANHEEYVTVTVTQQYTLTVTCVTMFSKASTNTITMYRSIIVTQCILSVLCRSLQCNDRPSWPCTLDPSNNCVCLHARDHPQKVTLMWSFIILSSFSGRTSWMKGLHEPKLRLCAWTRPSPRAIVSPKKSISSLSSELIFWYWNWQDCLITFVRPTAVTSHTL